MENTVLYFSDFKLNQYNSVRDILYSIIHQDKIASCKHIIAASSGALFNPVKIEEFEGIKHYSAPASSIKNTMQNKNLTLLTRLSFSFKRTIFNILNFLNIKDRYLSTYKIKYFEKVIEEINPNIIVCLTFSPPKPEIINIFKNLNIPYIQILYDTYIERPYTDKEKVFLHEKYAIENSEGYFVPDFFYKCYSETYNNPKVISYKLPLLIEKNDVVSAYQNVKHRFDFVHFGQIQSFRNGDNVKEIFKALNITLDVFSTNSMQSDDTFIHHDAISKKELYETITGTKYLVILDNGEPYTKYLPSKVYLYISFTKPILVFGNNKESALKTFLKDYPYFYYHDMDDDIVKLKKFIDTHFENKFYEPIYSEYIQYLPENALNDFINLVIQVLNKK